MTTEKILNDLYAEEVQLLKDMLKNVSPRTKNGYLQPASATFLFGFKGKPESILKKYLNIDDIWALKFEEGTDHTGLMLEIETILELLNEIYMAAIPLLNATFGKPNQCMVSSLDNKINEAKDIISPPLKMSPDEDNIFKAMGTAFKTLSGNDLYFGEGLEQKSDKIFSILINYDGCLANSWKKRPDERKNMLIEFILAAAKERKTLFGLFQAKNAQTRTLNVFYHSLNPGARTVVFNALLIPEDEHAEIKDFITFSEKVNSYRQLGEKNDNRTQTTSICAMI